MSDSTILDLLNSIDKSLKELVEMQKSQLSRSENSSTSAIDQVSHAILLISECGGNKTEIARRLGINVRTMYRPRWAKFQEVCDRYIASEGLTTARAARRGIVCDGRVDAVSGEE